LLVTEALPVTLPVAAGAKITFSVAVLSGSQNRSGGYALELKPAPEMLVFEIVMLELPEL